MSVRMRNGRPHEEVCDECENTNGEHKPWCKRHRVFRDRLFGRGDPLGDIEWSEQQNPNSWG